MNNDILFDRWCAKTIMGWHDSSKYPYLKSSYPDPSWFSPKVGGVCLVENFRPSTDLNYLRMVEERLVSKGLGKHYWKAILDISLPKGGSISDINTALLLAPVRTRRQALLSIMDEIEEAVSDNVRPLKDDEHS